MKTLLKVFWTFQNRLLYPDGVMEFADYLAEAEGQHSDKLKWRQVKRATPKW